MAGEAIAAVEHGEGEEGGEGGGGHVVGTRLEGDSAETVDSEDWSKIDLGTKPDEDPGAKSGKDDHAGGDIPDAVGAVVSGAANSNPEPGARRRLRTHQQEEPRGRQGQGQRQRREASRRTASLASDDGESVVQGGTASATALAAATAATAVTAATAAETSTRRRTAGAGWGWGWSGHAAESDTAIKNKERVRRLERGSDLWGGTYAPPIEPQRRKELTEKWSDAQRGGGAHSVRDNVVRPGLQAGARLQADRQA